MGKEDFDQKIRKIVEEMADENGNVVLPIPVAAYFMKGRTIDLGPVGEMLPEDTFQGSDLLQVTPDDPVNHPSHYTSHPSGVECIEITRHMNFNLGNAVKYIWRAGLKDQDATLEDLRKAAWYLNDEIKRREKEL